MVCISDWRRVSSSAASLWRLLRSAASFSERTPEISLSRVRRAISISDSVTASFTASLRLADSRASLSVMSSRSSLSFAISARRPFVSWVRVSVASLLRDSMRAASSEAAVAGFSTAAGAGASSARRGANPMADNNNTLWNFICPRLPLHFPFSSAGRQKSRPPRKRGKGRPLRRKT